MTRFWSMAVAPASAAYAVIRLFKYATNAGSADSYLFIHQVFAGIAPADASIINQTPYRQSGVTTIDGHGIVTNSITADKIAVTSLSAMTATIGLLRTAASGGRMELTDNVLTVYDETNALRVKLGYLG